MNQTAEESIARIQPATLEDLPMLTELTMDLFHLQHDFRPDHEAQARGLQMILEQPQRGRIFVVRTDDYIFGMVNLLFTISTALGGPVILMEDFIIHPDHRGQGYGAKLIDYVLDYANQKQFKRITLLTDKMSADSQNFFQNQGFEYSQLIPMRKILD
ncbi:GNAT family N-acetyltransferase [Persicirhabdus sediminis]|uniref:GNAT family N-acetyltransferase n=1 Tax=Persicirhabdus sediminis TaxID=454144 RepID=A0A8J7MG20_9BACT|nr:GNAT family N-acetyltransferase [Persicirhabdus sediminis]MBK1792407.1 GNAT family N-acetyltransferase [Persicirhabdus sediminis]